MKLKVTNIGTENFGGEHDVIEVNFRIDLDEMYVAYLDADLTVDRDSLHVGGHDVDEVINLLNEQIEEKQEEIVKVVSESVFGSNDFVLDSNLFGVWLNSWGVYKYVGTEGECGVVVCHAGESDLRINSKAKVFASNDEFNNWYDEMMGDSYHGDASAVKRAIDDIEGYN